jgi:hypothetical protein
MAIASMRNFFVALISTASTVLAIQLHCIAGDSNVVGLDVPAILVAQSVNPAVVESPTTGGKLVRIKIPVSTFLSTEFQGTVSEYLIEIHNPRQSMRVVDFWPKTEVYSEVAGTVAVQSSYHKDNHFAFKISGGYEPFVRGNADGQFNERADVQQSYQRKPPMQLLTAAGTIGRGYGVFYKFRPGPLPQLEGEREVAILCEVPIQWRADLMQVSMRAVGQGGSSTRTVTLGEGRLWITVHQEGDQAAATQAQRYVAQERNLRALAASCQQQVEEKSFPTVWHKVGAALEVVDPKIPADYLNKVLFSLPTEQLNNRLPVDLRVAILDYWDARNALIQL